MSRFSINFEKITGYSFEDILEILDSNRINYKIIQQPKAEQKYFRSSAIVMTPEDEQNLMRHIVLSQHKAYRCGHSDFYYAEWVVAGGSSQKPQSIQVERVKITTLQ